MTIREFFDSCPDATTLNGGLDISWSRSGRGFGSFYFYKGDDGKLRCSSECMSREFVKAVLSDLVDSAIFDDEPKPPLPKDSGNG